MYLATKAADSTRPCIDTSGNYHVVTDIFDLHDYEQNPEKFAEHYKDFAEKGEFDHRQAFKDRQTYDKKMPFFISEYGGIGWSGVGGLGGNDRNDAWGYGNAPKDAQEFFERYKGLTEAMLFNESICGFCYTQLYDIEQEVNGLYTYERKQKFDINIIKEINQQKAKIED